MIAPVRRCRQCLLSVALVVVLALAAGCRDDGETTPTASPEASPTAIPMLPIATPTPGVPAPAAETNAPEVTEAPAPAESADANDGSYVVQPGDTLFSIAVRFGVSVEALAAANGLGDSTTIVAGQVLVIPDRGRP